MPTKGRVQVAPGQVIQSTVWGNPLWDQSVQEFASVADRNTQYPAPHNGSVCWTAAEGQWWGYRSGVWVPMWAGSAGYAASRTSAAGVGGGTFNLLVGITVTAAPARTYLVIGEAHHSRPGSWQDAYLRISCAGNLVGGDTRFSSWSVDDVTKTVLYPHTGGDLTVNLYSQLPLGYNAESGSAIIVIGV